MRICRSLLLLLVVVSIPDARAGGFLGDAVRGTGGLMDPGLADQLDKSHNSLGSAVDQQNQSRLPGGSGDPTKSVNPALTGQSNVCLTREGACALPGWALKGASCYCGTGPTISFGFVQ
jgi:hypothetical protein